MLHPEFNDLMENITKNQKYRDSGENVMMKIQIEFHGDKNKLGENCESQLSDQEVFS